MQHLYGPLLAALQERFEKCESTKDGSLLLTMLGTIFKTEVSENINRDYPNRYRSMHSLGCRCARAAYNC